MILQNCRFVGIDSLGKKTISVLDLNDSDRHATPRYLLANAVLSVLEDLDERMEEYRYSPNTWRRNRIIRGLKGVLKEAQPESIRAATIATAVASSQHYHSLKNDLNTLGLWDAELLALDTNTTSIAFKITR
jgi:hypothetical protein